MWRAGRWGWALALGCALAACGGAGGAPPASPQPQGNGAAVAGACDGLVPERFGPAREEVVPLGTAGAALRAAVDGDGAFAVFDAGYREPGAVVSLEARPRGFHAIAWESAVALGFEAFEGGAVVAARTTRGAAFALAAAPQGGSVLLSRLAGDASGATTLVEWVDAGGQPVRAIALDRAADALVATRSGAVLVLAPDPVAPPSARWLDALGAPLTGWFELGDAAGAGIERLAVLLDGTVAMASAGAWALAIPEARAEVAPAPAWLAARPGTSVAAIRGGRGYAVLGGAAPPLEIVAAGGEPCGALARGPGRRRAGRAVRRGRRVAAREQRGGGRRGARRDLALVAGAPAVTPVSGGGASAEASSAWEAGRRSS